MTDFRGHDPHFIDSIGGSVSFAEGFDIHIYQSEEESFCRFIFRDVKRGFSPQKFEEFI